MTPSLIAVVIAGLTWIALHGRICAVLKRRHSDVFVALGSPGVPNGMAPAFGTVARLR